MSLPRVKINFENGALGSVSPSDDGVVGLIVSGVDEGDRAINTPFLITNFATLDLTETTNATAYKAVKEFYQEAPEGTKLWVMLVAAATATAKDVCNKDTGVAKQLLIKANGDINLLVVKINNQGTVASGDALYADVTAAISNAQALAEWATDNLYAPCFVLLEGRGYNGEHENLTPLYEGEKNRVAILIGDTDASSSGAAVGLLAGRIAAIPVQRSIARVKSGAIASDDMYIGGVAAESGNPDLVSDKGYICPRTFVGKAGYFWSDDKLATAPEDDYALIPRRRTIDKAYRIAYQTLVDELSEEIPVGEDGLIPAPIIKALEDQVETAIINTMGSDGNLSTDSSNDKDTGVICYINPEQNIVSNSQLDISLKIRPFGYAKYINVSLGFSTTSTSN